MEKIIIMLQKRSAQDSDRFRESLLGETVQSLLGADAEKLRICVSDSAVETAAPFKLLSADAYDAMISFWLDSARAIGGPLGILEPLAASCHAYLVTESEPITRQWQRGERSIGMNQVVTLKQPSRLSRDEWLELWLNQHTQLAIDIQSTFGYRQNVIARHLKAGQPEFAAIVEENFPEAAMTSRQAFYDAVGNEELYQQREQQMMESTMRFIDFEDINCVPMSEYNF